MKNYSPSYEEVWNAENIEMESSIREDEELGSWGVPGGDPNPVEVEFEPINTIFLKFWWDDRPHFGVVLPNRLVGGGGSSRMGKLEDMWSDSR